MKRAAIYARVVTDTPPNENKLKQQISLLYEYADRHDYDVMDVFQEVSSGIEEDRPELQHLMTDAAANLFDVVLFLDPTRLFRGLTLFQEYYRRLRDDCGVDVVFVLFEDEGGEA